MKAFLRPISCVVLVAFLTVSLNVRGEAVDDKLTQISPDFKPGSGEYIHGTGYGKILMRVMMFGAVGAQGIHYFPEGTDLLFAILSSGGVGEQTKLNGTTIRRRNVKNLIEIDLEDLIEEGKAIPKLADGDVINVPFNWRRNYQQFMFYTQVLFSITGFLLAVVALSRLK
jgi:hypothetical protein